MNKKIAKIGSDMSSKRKVILEPSGKDEVC